MASTTADRSHKLVMGLGIVAILLFSANLITAIVHHFWPDQESRVLHFTSESWADTDATAEVYTIGRSNGHHKFVIRHRHAAPEVELDLNVETDLDQEIAELERRIEIEAMCGVMNWRLNSKKTSGMRPCNLPKKHCKKPNEA